MCNALRELMKDEIAQEVAQAENKAKLESKLESIMDVMKSFSVNADRAMDALRIPAEEREIYRSKLP